MVVWKVIANEIGNNGNGALYAETKEEAWRILRDHKKTENAGIITDEPEKIVIKNRADLCRELNDAMGYGCS